VLDSGSHINAGSERRAKRVRSTALFGADPCGLSLLRNLQSDKQLGNQATEIVLSVRPYTQNDDGDREACQVLLERQATVNGDYRVEVILCSVQELTVGETCPAGIW
jgi:hypothetical protein